MSEVSGTWQGNEAGGVAGVASGMNAQSGKALTFTTGQLLGMPAQPEAGRKYDGGKEPLAQGCFAYFGKALAAVAGISAYGANKYQAKFSDQDWRKVENGKGRYADALLRHLKAHLSGELTDAESGKAHIDMVAWNALALSELEKS